MDTIKKLRAEAQSYQAELRSLNGKIQRVEEQVLQETPAENIGKEVRLRYLEQPRQRMGRGIGMHRLSFVGNGMPEIASSTELLPDD